MSETLEGDFNEGLQRWNQHFREPQIDQMFKSIPQDVWEQGIKDLNTSLGWICDRDDETTLGFSDHQGECHWIKDYNKKTRTFVQYNGNQVVHLVTSNKKAETND